MNSPVTLSPTWTDDATVSKPAYDAMPKDERALIDSNPNKWEWDWASERYYNVQHPANEEWAMMRQMMDARGMIGG